MADNEHYKYEDTLGFSKPFGYNPIETDKVMDKLNKDIQDLEDKLSNIIIINEQLEKSHKKDQEELDKMRHRFIDFQMQVSDLKIERPTADERDKALDDFHDKIKSKPKPIKIKKK